MSYMSMDCLSSFYLTGLSWEKTGSFYPGDQSWNQSWQENSLSDAAEQSCDESWQRISLR